MSQLQKPAGLRRRDIHRLAAGAGALGALGPRFAGTARVAHASAADAPLSSITPVEQFGVNEAFKAMKLGTMTGAGWTRYTVQWFNVQPQPGDLNVHYFRDHKGASILEAQVAAGMKVAAMVLGTPEWAAETPGLKTGTSVPRGLSEPVLVGDQPNPQNTWGFFMYELARQYAGLMDVFEIWNEVEIPATGSNAVYNTWAGTPEQYYQLLAVASEAAKAANPSAKIVTSPYSYFKDQEEGSGQRLPWFEAFGETVKANGAHVFDAVALNLYRNPHDLWDRMYGGVPLLQSKADVIGFRARLDAMGAAGKPVWLTEINAMPYDDVLPGWNPSAKNDGFRITMDEQASYVLQAHAMAAAAGYEKVFFQALQDDPYPVPDELWGLVRYNGDAQDEDPARIRPAFTAYQLASQYIGDAQNADLYVRIRADHPVARYRQYASRWKWAAHAVVADKGAQRTYVLWNGSEAPQTVNIKPWGAEAKLINKHGQELPLLSQGGRYVVVLDPATRHFELFGGDPPNYFYVGGSPLLLVEQGVPPGADVEIANFVKKDKRPDTMSDPDVRD